MTFYQVLVSIKQYDGEWVSPKQLPSIILSADTLGIVDSNHARKIARSMVQEINPMIAWESITVHVDRFEL